MDELQQAVAPFLHASGGGIGGVNPPPAPSDNSLFVCTDEPAQEVGEVSQKAPRKREWETPFDEKKEMRLADKHMKVCEKHIQRIIERAQFLYENKNLELDIKEKDDIERGVQSYFADIYDFPSKESRRKHLNEVLKTIGKERSRIWKRVKGLIENSF
jgi:hypothetical protein